MATGNVVPLQRPVDPVEVLRKIGLAADSLEERVRPIHADARLWYFNQEAGTADAAQFAHIVELADSVRAFADAVKAAVEGVQ